MGYKVAVVGATGNVGREMLNILDERKFPADEVVALASRRSMGVEVSYGDRTLKCKALEHYDFSDTDICLMSAGGAVSKEWAPRIAEAGAVVIDNSSAWRMDPDVPLVVPEVNPDALRSIPKGIVANPNCTTMVCMPALAPLHREANLRRLTPATYQAVSGPGLSTCPPHSTRPASTPVWWAGSGLTRAYPTTEVWPCSSRATTCAKGPHSTRSRSPRSYSTGG